ncbi:MAG: translation initiation factor IF-2, partial [Eubacteriales bacterium]
PQGDRPYNNNYRGNNNGDRPQGDRPYNNNYRGNNNGDRPNNGYRGNAGGPGGDRRGASAPKTDSIALEQKPTRAKTKPDFAKKKDYSNKKEDKAPRNAKGKIIAPVQRPQHKKVEVVEKIKMITIPEILTIGELADKMKIVSSTIIKKLFLEGKIVTVNHELTYEAAEEIALEYEILCEKEVVVDVIEELLKEEEESEESMVKRPPVICVMGHVDHGKTSLLDKIRSTSVTDREAGGITQHIGAYVTQVGDEKITFLDTPGHEAFTSMRMRGANSTDIAILVVAADDGVMPQTVEAINHAKAAGIEIIVAVNKIDKPGANIERVKQELTEYELIAEDWGGSTVFAPVSAKTGEGVEELLEMILLTSEILELKANADRNARGLVIEAELDKGKGSVATVLVQKGTLRVGDAIAAGSAFGRVRAMMDDKGRRIEEAGPSIPVEILGLNAVPNAGEVFVVCENDKEARTFGETFISQNRMKMLDETKSKSMSLDDIFNQIQEGNLKELPIIVKADVQGSVEAMKQSLLKITNEEVVVKVIHGGVGAINESDVILASASNAIIIGFNVRPDASAKETADREGVDVRLYSVIYSAIEDIDTAMKGMLAPVFEEKVLGHAEIRQIFKASGVGNIAGSYVLDGTFERGCSVRVTREGETIFDGPLASLKRFKDDVKEVRAGYECGFVFEKFNDVKEEDKVESYKMVEVPRS